MRGTGRITGSWRAGRRGRALGRLGECRAEGASVPLAAGFRRAPREFGDQPAGHRGGEQRVAPGDGCDTGDQRAGRGVFEQEPAGAGLERFEDILVEVVGGEDEYLDAGGPG
jgi:hypothetical protein